MEDKIYIAIEILGLQGSVDVIAASTNKERLITYLKTKGFTRIEEQSGGSWAVSTRGDSCNIITKDNL